MRVNSAITLFLAPDVCRNNYKKSKVGRDYIGGLNYPLLTWCSCVKKLFHKIEELQHKDSAHIRCSPFLQRDAKSHLEHFMNFF